MSDPYDNQLELLIETAMVHDENAKTGIQCSGLPRCVSCRAVALLMNDLNPMRAELFISNQPKNKVLRLKDI